MTDKKVRLILFIFISFFVWFIYFITQAPTVVFWDVGEFLATSVILGVPHPPGTPLYVILGKFMTLLPLPLDLLYKLVHHGAYTRNVVLKITLIATLTGGLTAGLIYLISVDLIDLWDHKLPRHLVHLAAAFGALIGAFAQTVWFNSTEAETYTPANFIIVLTAWLALKWWKEKDNPESLALLIFIGYITLLGTGIHLGALVGFPAIILFVFVTKKELLWDIKLIPLLDVFLLLWMATKLSYEPTRIDMWLNLFFIGILLLYLWYQKSLDISNLWVLFIALSFVASFVGIFTGYLWPQILASLVSIVAIYFKDKLYKDWRGLTFILMLVGLSAEFFLMIRGKWGAMHPALLHINEAEPDDWKSFLDVLTRKQYEPMKIFPRRIPFGDQLAVFWLYYSWQYGNLLIPITLLFLIGFIVHFANEWKTFTLIGGILILATFGLIMYLNLKDSPTHPINPMNPTEVRDRDYFFALGYTFIGLYAGLGLFEVLKLMKENIKLPAVTEIVGYVLAFGILAWQIAWAYPYRDRSGNYIAEDSAYNILNSPEKGKGKCVLFTNGDNDTFPLWFDQEVLHIRQDVIVANLSLLNTNWYCRQLKGWGAPISFSYADIDKLYPVYRGENGKYIFLRDIMIRDMIATSTGYKPGPDEYLVFPNGLRIPKIYFASKKEFLEKVIKGATFKVPIYFAVTVTREVLKGWNEYLLTQGLAFKLVGYKAGQQGMEGMDGKYTTHLMHDDMPPDSFIVKYAEKPYPEEGVFRYRGIFNKKVYKDLTHEKIVRNYASIALRASFYYEGIDSIERAAQELKFARSFLYQINPKTSPDLPGQIAAVDLKLGELLQKNKDYMSAIEAFKDAIKWQPIPYAYAALGKTYLLSGDTTKASEYLNLAINTGQAGREVYKELIELYIAKGETSRAATLLKEWIQKHPADTILKGILSAGPEKEGPELLK